LPQKCYPIRGYLYSILNWAENQIFIFYLLFIEIVDKILAITKSSDYLENPAKKEEVKEYEKQIDQMVYKLYGLTEDEIEIVEENL